MGHVLVTGGAGYIGSHTCKALAKVGYTPVAYDNLSAGNEWAVQWGPLERGDILDAAKLSTIFDQYRPLGVIHFAAASLVGESVAAPGHYYRTNVLGGLNLVEAARQFDVPFILSSTCAVYGTPAHVPISEDAPLAPINPYGASKVMLERILADFGASHGVRFMALRYFNAAGADKDGIIGERRPVETHLIPLALDAVAGRRPPLTLFGNDYPTPDGTPIRDYVHVDDLAQAHVRGLEYLFGGGVNQSVNLGSGKGSSVRDVLDEIAAVTGSTVPCHVAARRPGDAAVLVADPSLAETTLGSGLTQNSDLRTIVASAWAWHTSTTYHSAFAGA